MLKLICCIRNKSELDNERKKRMGPGGVMPGRRYNYERVPRPKSLKEVPSYLKKLLGGFFKRLFYIFALVWKTGPWILISMSIITLILGFLPVTGTIISKEILNSLQLVVKSSDAGSEISFWGSAVMLFIILLFTQRLINRIIHNVYNAVTRIAGEKVVKQVRVQIMEKARELDISSFDIPGFYEKLENANREAGTRPITIMVLMMIPNTLNILTQRFGILRRPTAIIAENCCKTE